MVPRPGHHGDGLMIAILCYGKRVLAPMHRTRRCRAAEIRFSNRDGIATLMRLVATVRGGAAAPNYTGAINNRTSPIAKGAAAGLRAAFSIAGESVRPRATAIWVTAHSMSRGCIRPDRRFRSALCCERKQRCSPSSWHFDRARRPPVGDGKLAFRLAPLKGSGNGEARDITIWGHEHMRPVFWHRLIPWAR